MDVAALLDAARSQTGLGNFGDDGFRVGLERLVDALAREADLSDMGTLALETQIATSLANRLRIVDWCGHHPDVAEERIEAPLVVVGLPRTGTTLLLELLHRDPTRRCLMRWEAHDSVPPPDVATLTSDPRIERARAGAAALDTMNPEFKAIHYEAPDGPTECVTLLAQDFRSLQWSCLADVPSYDAWLLACDETTAYEYHHRALRVLQSGGARGRWSLKTPHHCLALNALFEQYPDARIVVTHRDPVTAVASLCSLVRSLAGTFTDADHGAAMSVHWPDVAHAIVERLMAFRDGHGDDAFFDVAYADLVRDPVGVVAQIYDWAGDELTGAAETAMRRYVAEHPRGEHGRHGYSLDELGLDRDALDARFAAYRERYDIPRDA